MGGLLLQIYKSIRCYQILLKLQDWHFICHQTLHDLSLLLKKDYCCLICQICLVNRNS